MLIIVQDRLLIDQKMMEGVLISIYLITNLIEENKILRSIALNASSSFDTNSLSAQIRIDEKTLFQSSCLLHGLLHYHHHRYVHILLPLLTRQFISGTTIGGWIGGLFEFIFSGNHGCSDVHNGHLYCENKYASGNISTSCVNIFYKNSIMVTAPYICLCRFRNQSNGKYRDCDFLHAKIR